MPPHFRRRLAVGGALLLSGGLLAYFVISELKGSELQAHYLSGVARELTYRVEPGASPPAAIRFPQNGPYDKRLGYVQLPAMLQKLTTRGYRVEAQARVSARLASLTDMGLYPIYREKTQAGLTLLDRSGKPLFTATYPQRVYANFESVPPLVINTLLDIENRELLDTKYPHRNPVVEWDRLARATLDNALHAMNLSQEAPGGSTLATQIEKYRHSPDGRTSNARDKLQQMASASLRAYLDGRETLGPRRGIILAYLNSVPLAATAGFGEVNGLGDGLWAWYGLDFKAINQALQQPETSPQAIAEKGLAYRHVLSLLLSERRPSYYLAADRNALATLTDRHLRRLAADGVISAQLRDAALAARAKLLATAPPLGTASFVESKGANVIRTKLAGMLDIPRLYDLDRMDARVQSTLDGPAQEAVTQVLRQLKDPEFVKSAGLNAERMLDKGDPAKVIYSFTLYERTEGGNLLRVQTDNFDQPFDINEGTKLDLGSTAKLRTLITYLEIIADLHKRFADKAPEELRKETVDRGDKLTAWAVEYLSRESNDRSLMGMLNAAMDRRYSANPHEGFYTGGGVHTFSNFKHEDDGKVLAVRDALKDSVNLVFVRMMRDIVHHYMFQVPGSTAKILEDEDDPRREKYLQRFADREGSVFMSRFWRKYKGKSADEAVDLLLQQVNPTPVRLATIHRTIYPEADFATFAGFMRKRLPREAEDKELERLYTNYAVDKYNLADRGYLAHIHPLELWLVAYLRTHASPTLQHVLEAGREERQEVYSWLFKTRHKNAQDNRILSLIELEGFLEIHRAWKRLGYPFDGLVPSYATALGSSADRPAALAELMGIIVNDGVRLPPVRVDRVHFAPGTPYETLVERMPQKGERVLAPEVAQTARNALLAVVEAGTARRVSGAFKRADGTVIPVGGKTGTGDHRFDVYGAGGRLIESKVMNRAGVFVFYIGNRFFGTLTAYVHGQEAAKFDFTSSLPSAILKLLAPALMPLVETQPGPGEGRPPIIEASHEEPKNTPVKNNLSGL